MMMVTTVMMTMMTSSRYSRPGAPMGHGASIGPHTPACTSLVHRWYSYWRGEWYVWDSDEGYWRPCCLACGQPGTSLWMGSFCSTDCEERVWPIKRVWPILPDSAHPDAALDAGSEDHQDPDEDSPDSAHPHEASDAGLEADPQHQIQAQSQSPVYSSSTPPSSPPDVIEDFDSDGFYACGFCGSPHEIIGWHRWIDTRFGAEWHPMCRNCWDPDMSLDPAPGVDLLWPQPPLARLQIQEAREARAKAEAPEAMEAEAEAKAKAEAQPAAPAGNKLVRKARLKRPARHTIRRPSSEMKP